MTEIEPNPTDHVPGFKTVWTAKDAGPQQDVACPNCDKVFGSVGLSEQKELLCRGCQTIFLVKGSEEGEATAEALRRTIVIETESDCRLGDALRGKRPDFVKLTKTDIVFNLIIIIALFIAIAIAMQ